MNKTRNLLLPILLAFYLPTLTGLAEEIEGGTQMPKVANNQASQASDWREPSESKIADQTNPWTVISRETTANTSNTKLHSTTPLANILNNGGGLGNLIYMATFFFFGTAISYVLKIVFFRKKLPKKIVVTIFVSLLSIALLVLLIVDVKVNSNVAGMLTASFAFGAWRSLNNQMPKMSDEATQPNKLVTAIDNIKNSLVALNLKQRLAISVLLPFFLYFAWKGLSSVLFEDYESEIIFSGPWWFWSAYFLGLILLEIMILNDQNRSTNERDETN